MFGQLRACQKGFLIADIYIPQTFRSYCTNPCVMELSYSLCSSYDVPINCSAFLVHASGCNSILLALTADGKGIYSVCIQIHCRTGMTMGIPVT